MSPPSSSSFCVKEIPGAGRGVVARASIPAGSSILSTSDRGPIADVVFRPYRREVCAWCFFYNRGRSLPVREFNESGKVFCCSDCRDTWVKSQGALGIEAWHALETFVKTRSKAITNIYGDAAIGDPPGEQAIDGTWEEAENVAALQRLGRTSAATISGPGIKAQKEYRRAIHHTWTQPVNPDILVFFLSGLLSKVAAPQRWEADISGLAPDLQPYRSNADLEAHCNAFLQLTAIVPILLLDRLTPQLCHQLVAATSHNSFGLHSGSEDGDEYLGHALFPEASFFNHCCRPNVKKVRTGRRWEFRAAREVVEGEQLCIAYLGGDEDYLSVAERRKRLVATWGFECQCARCCEESATS